MFLNYIVFRKIESISTAAVDASEEYVQYMLGIDNEIMLRSVKSQLSSVALR